MANQSTICPSVDKLICTTAIDCDDKTYCAGIWSNKDGSFAARKNVDCNIPEENRTYVGIEVVDDYLIKCNYDFVDKDGITYHVSLYNESYIESQSK
ncbi:MAG: hypothetical protein KDH94_06520 [Coxiellaceae bacterium]|nr:hypothetical protein [Coxiellaceae bacterium]